MSYEQKPNTGSLFKNTEKGPDRVLKNKAGEEFTVPDPDYTGTVTVTEPGEYWINATLKKSKKGTMYMALRLNPKPKKAPPKGVLTEDNWGSADLNDDMPF